MSDPAPSQDLSYPAAEDGSFQWIKHFDVVLVVPSGVDSHIWLRELTQLWSVLISLERSRLFLHIDAPDETVRFHTINSIGDAEECRVTLRDLFGACLGNTAPFLQEEFKELFLQARRRNFHRSSRLRVSQTLSAPRIKPEIVSRAWDRPQEMAVLSESLRHFKSRIGSIVWVRSVRAAIRTYVGSALACGSRADACLEPHSTSNQRNC